MRTFSPFSGETDQSGEINAISARSRSSSIFVQAVIRGCKGGFIATVIMTVYRIPIFRALPPTAEFWAQYVGGGGAEDYPLQGFLLHLLYGIIAGGVFGPLFTAISSLDPDHRELLGVVSGAIYSLLLSLFGTRVIFKHVLNRELEPDHALVFHVGHLIYGLTLGTWLSSQERIGQVYDSPAEE